MFPVAQLCRDTLTKQPIIQINVPLGEVWKCSALAGGSTGGCQERGTVAVSRSLGATSCLALDKVSCFAHRQDYSQGQRLNWARSDEWDPEERNMRGEARHTHPGLHTPHTHTHTLLNTHTHTHSVKHTPHTHTHTTPAHKLLRASRVTSTSARDHSVSWSI